MISYAQNFEDVILWRAFKNVHKGFYIDIGAQDPVVDSISYAFYKQGWLGVDVEPNKYYFDLLRASRPKNAVKQLIISDHHNGSIPFYEIPLTGLSSANLNIAEKNKAAGYEIIEKVIEVATLDFIFDSCASDIIHWLKIDVEGFELNVLNSWKKSKHRPWIILIESTVPGTSVENYYEWEPILIAKEYQFVYFDGLNRFYVHRQHQELLQHFKLPINVFDDFALSGLSTNSFSNHLLLKSKESEVNARYEILKAIGPEAKAQIDALKAKESEAKAQIDALKVDLANLGQLNHHHWALAGERQIKIDAIYTSTSWRITLPMRWIVNKWRMFTLSDFKQTIKRNIKIFLYSLNLRKPKSTDYFPENTGDIEALPNSEKEMNSTSIMMTAQAKRIYQHLKSSIERRKKLS